MSVLEGRSVMTCSLTQPPLSSLVLESEKLHFKLGTTPLSVLCAPRLSGFCKSICLFVPPMLGELAGVEDHWPLGEEEGG